MDYRPAALDPPGRQQQGRGVEGRSPAGVGVGAEGEVRQPALVLERDEADAVVARGGCRTTSYLATVTRRPVGAATGAAAGSIPHLSSAAHYVVSE